MLKIIFILFFLSFKSYANKIPYPLYVDKEHAISDLNQERTSSGLSVQPLELQHLEKKVDKTRAAYSTGIEEICRWGLGRASPKMKHLWSENLKAWNKLVEAWNRYHTVLAEYNETEKKNHNVGMELVALSLRIIQFLDEHERAQDAHDKALKEAHKNWNGYVIVMNKLIAQNLEIQELREEYFKTDEAYENLMAEDPEIQQLKEKIEETGERYAMAKDEFVDQSPKLRQLKMERKKAKEKYERAEAALVAENSELRPIWEEYNEVWVESVPSWVEYDKIDEERQRPMNRFVAESSRYLSMWLRDGFVGAKEELLAKNPALQRLLDKYSQADEAYFSARRIELLGDSPELQVFREKYLRTKREHKRAIEEHHEARKALLANSSKLQQLLGTNEKAQERYINARLEFIDQSPELQAFKQRNEEFEAELEKTEVELKAQSLELQQLWESYDEVTGEYGENEDGLAGLSSELKFFWDEVVKAGTGYQKHWTTYLNARTELATQFPKLAHFWGQYIKAWNEHNEARTTIKKP